MTTNQVIAKYGKPNETGKGYLTVIQLPYPMYLSYDKNVKVTRMSCHKLLAETFKTIFADILYTYGLDEIQRLKIDEFGGCFNYRKMRNGNAWSKHSWGIAIDLYPSANGLKTKWKDSAFSKPEYKKLIEIFEFNGFINLGKEYGFDSMHFQTKN